MKQNVRPSMAILLAVIAVALLGFVGYKVMAGSSAQPQANPRPADPNDDRYKAHLPPGVGGGNQ